jgi:hypothetical protein
MVIPVPLGTRFIHCLANAQFKIQSQSSLLASMVKNFEWGKDTNYALHRLQIEKIYWMASKRCRAAVFFATVQT